MIHTPIPTLPLVPYTHKTRGLGMQFTYIA
jgi:hypothetical protein